MSTATAARNVRTHTGMVHAGRIDRATGRTMPACMSSQQTAGVHYAAGTDDAVTCSKCTKGQASAEAEAAKPLKAFAADLVREDAAQIATWSAEMAEAAIVRDVERVAQIAGWIALASARITKRAGR